MCWGLFGIICVTIKGNLLNSQSIDLEWIGTDLGSHMQCVVVCLALFVSLHSQLRWLDLFPETVQYGKQDTSCGIVFALVCESKFGNFAEPWLIEIIGPSMSHTVFCHSCI